MRFTILLPLTLLALFAFTEGGQLSAPAEVAEMPEPAALAPEDRAEGKHYDSFLCPFLY